MSLIDAIDNQTEAAPRIEGGLRKPGIDPAKICIVIVTHHHDEQHRGVPYLLDRRQPRVAMSDRDWTMTRLDLKSSLWPPPRRRDLAVGDGEQVRLGDTTVTITHDGRCCRHRLADVQGAQANGVHRVL
ncbi:MAG: MBL fold metallo-hydrolase, partial [Rhizobacter sp.]|nr:MBL fold metallo-hydrolase [Rhizobacter sp.]